MASLGVAALLVVAGIGLLLFGGDRVVSAAVRLAALVRATPAMMAVTVVALGTSLPELMVSAYAAWQKKPDLSVGNVVGSNVFNMALVLGVAACIRPLRVRRRMLHVDVVAMLVASALLAATMRNGEIRFFDGLLLIACLALFVLAVRLSRGADAPLPNLLDSFSEAHQSEIALARLRRLSGTPRRRALVRESLWVLLASALLYGGSEALIRGAVGVATALSISERLMGLTLLAMGTSLPEVAASAMAAWRGRTDVAVANAVGSNIINALGVVGITAMLHPLEVHPCLIRHDVPWMLAIVAVASALMAFRRRVSRRGGLLLLLLFCAYGVSLGTSLDGACTDSLDALLPSK